MSDEPRIEYIPPAQTVRVCPRDGLMLFTLMPRWPADAKRTPAEWRCSWCGGDGELPAFAVR